MHNPPPSFAVVAPYLPAPASTGGRIRIHRLARALSFHGPVDLYARFWPVELTAGDVTSALSVYRHRSLHGAGLGVTLPGFAPKRVREASPLSLRIALRRAHEGIPYAAVVVCHSYAGAVAEGLRGAALVLDEHNIESRYARELNPRDLIEHARLELWEQALWRSADLVTAVSDGDANAIAVVRHRTTEVIPNGVSASEIDFVEPSRRSSRELLFVGAMSHPPNVRCANELALEVLPRVRQRYPDARLVLCGRAPTAAVLGLASEYVEVTGTVDDVRPYLARAGAYVNLLRAGAGSSLKVPEAMAAGIPLVTTEVGARGFDLRDGVHCRVVNTAAQAAQAVLDTWGDPREADERAVAGRRIAASLDWEALGARFATAVLDAAARRGRP